MSPVSASRYAIVVAGGKGLRMGSDLPKQFLPLAGRPVLMHTLERFVPLVERLLLVLPEAHMAYWQELCQRHTFTHSVELVAGGETRFHSVQAALSHLPEQGWVAVHDGVRPLVSPDLIATCFAEALKQGAALPALPVTDSLRELQPAGASQAVDRARYVSVQTPQVFSLERLQQAYRQPYQESFTDDASVYEALGLGAPVLVAGQRTNIKLTTPQDLHLAQLLLTDPA